MFEIHLGIPEMEELWNRLEKKHQSGSATKAGRIFWCYGPDKGSITIIGLEPHPDDKANSYKKITLSAVGKEVP